MLATQVLPIHMAAHAAPVSRGSNQTEGYVSNAHFEPFPSYDSQTKGLSYAQHELLRKRKTPHGRLVEEHEVIHDDKNLQFPASKHVLLTKSPEVHPNPYGRHHKLLQEHPPDIYRGRPDDTILPNRTLVRRGEPTRPAWEFSGGIDSVLHQNTPLNDPRPYLFHGSNVPTVLPATLHTHLGPTASAAQQFYGPYWPDGTFSPYRPAPIRESRHFDRTSRLNDQQQSDYYQDARTLRRSGRRLPETPSFASPQHLDPVQQVSLNRYMAPLDFNPEHEIPQEVKWREQDVLVTDQTSRGNYHEPSLRDPVRVSNNRYLTNLESGNGPEDIMCRDRTFTWAHRIYVDLLAKMQRESRSNKAGGSFAHGRSSSKPTIFPKPPQRTNAHFKDEIHFSDGSWRKELNAPYPSCTNEGVQMTGNPFKMVIAPGSRGFEPQMPFSSHLLAREGFNGGNWSDGRNQIPRRCSDPSTFNHIPEPQHPQPHVVTSALDAMELLCCKASQPWTDGMLLAGCLAYGLSHYAKALSWYQKVLNQDPSHVEAMSNLAATLLALNRRGEALRYWSDAVKLRPSYFEAVEHLIGLLCSSQRPREAVDLLSFVESSLRLPDPNKSTAKGSDRDECDTVSRSNSLTTIASNDGGCFDFDLDRRFSVGSNNSEQQQRQHADGFGSSGYAIPGVDNGRLLALIHAKGNMLYALGDNKGAAQCFENAILISTGRRAGGVRSLIRQILRSCVYDIDPANLAILEEGCKEPILLSPERAQQTALRMFPPNGDLPGLEYLSTAMACKAAVSTTSNSMLSLAKIYQDGMTSSGQSVDGQRNGTREILALYYLSISLQRSPSTANNVGILLASVQHTTSIQVVPQCSSNEIINYTGIAPGSGIGLALQYYSYGLNIDPRHAHLYTNLGSLLKDLGQLSSAIKMYTKAVEFDPKFDIALANLANAVKDQGRIAEAINYYRRAVQASPDFAEAVCGLATALNSVCNWVGRGGIYADEGRRDKIHVDDFGMMHKAKKGSGLMNRVVQIVDKQLKDGEAWGMGVLTMPIVEQICLQLTFIKAHTSEDNQRRFYHQLKESLLKWSGRKWEGSRIILLIERAIRYIGWQWYQDKYKHGKEYDVRRYARPKLPVSLPSPTAPTVLPFHTFTTPLSAKQVRQISQRNALRISVSTLRSSWLPATVYPPPPPPAPYLRVGYVSSDFNNHPLAHLMQSVFGLHDQKLVRAYCYATTASDGSSHRLQIEREAPVFRDASSWSVDKLVNCIVKDGIHILINLNGYTRGAKNEVFAARPAPIHMSFMGFAGTLGAEWCDYVYADSISVPPRTLSPQRRNVEIEDLLAPDAQNEDAEDWVYNENIIFAKSTFFCVDHKQSSPDAKSGCEYSQSHDDRDRAWRSEQQRRWKLRKTLFPAIPDSAIILGNFNQLYKIDPSTFRLYLRILAAVPNSILWLLRFPDVGEQNLMSFAHAWAGPEVAARIMFTDVAPKDQHITRASVVDLFLDTPECNAHTTAADVVWSGTPIVTWARWEYKMCSRMASSIVASALPEGRPGDSARKDLLVNSEEEYESQAIRLASDLKYPPGLSPERGTGRLMDLRRMLWEGRWSSRLFDTKRWVNDLETAYWKAWHKWELGEGGDIWL